MFGFGKKPDHSSKFLEHLIENWKMRVRFANAFVAEYGTPLSVGLDRTTEALGKAVQAGKISSSQVHAGPDLRDVALVGQAYVGYMQDLRRGRHHGTDIEIAIWAILWNRTDLLEESDKLIADVIRTEQPKKFPELFDIAFV